MLVAVSKEEKDRQASGGGGKAVACNALHVLPYLSSYCFVTMSVRQLNPEVKERESNVSQFKATAHYTLARI